MRNTSENVEDVDSVAAHEVEMHVLADETGDEQAPIASDPQMRKSWDNGELVNQAQRHKVLALGSDYEKAKEMNIIRNLRLVREMGLRRGFEDLLRGNSNGSGAGKSSGPPSESDDYDDDDDDSSISAAENTPRVTRR